MLKLIPEWKLAWKMRSVQFTALIGTLPAIWFQLEPTEREQLVALATDLQISDGVKSAVALGITVYGIYLRLKDQGIAQSK